MRVSRHAQRETCSRLGAGTRHPLTYLPGAVELHQMRWLGRRRRQCRCSGCGVQADVARPPSRFSGNHPRAAVRRDLPVAGSAVDHGRITLTVERLGSITAALPPADPPPHRSVLHDPSLDLHSAASDCPSMSRPDDVTRIHALRSFDQAEVIAVRIALSTPESPAAPPAQGHAPDYPPPFLVINVEGG